MVFRNALVRANYNDLKNGIHETTEFLALFLQNLLLNETHPLHNRTLHISGTFKEPGKATIDDKKANIGEKKRTLEMPSHQRPLQIFANYKKLWVQNTYSEDQLWSGCSA